ncbi:MAG TPA: hypothetical protein VE130_03795, partial [Nitrososphaeraceae archaeon]|nr:hypothetical protein [Nitrososphaeraceae archaeon]
MLRAVQEEVSDHQQLAKSLVQDNANLKQMIEMNKMTLSILDELREMGLGLRELKRLDSDLKEISRANGLPSSDGSATERFLEVLEEDYDTTLGLKTEIQEQRRELTNLRKEINLQRVIYNISPRLNSLIETLLRKGFDEDDIVRAAACLENHPHLAE